MVDNEAESEADAFNKSAPFFLICPRMPFSFLPGKTPADDPNRKEEELLSIVPNNPTQKL